MAVTPHANSLMDLRDRVEVVAAFSPSRERREAFARRFPFPTCDSLDAIFDDPSIASILVLTPPNTHPRSSGAPPPRARTCSWRSRSRRRPSAPPNWSRPASAPASHSASSSSTASGRRPKRWPPCLRDGRLGAIAGCSATIRLWRPQSYYDEPGRGTFARDGGGVLISQGIHTLDLMLSLAGSVAEVRAFSATSPLHRMETEDVVAAAMRFENGALGTLDATTAAYPGFPERIEIIGRNGTAVLAGTGLEIAFHDGRTELVAPIATPGGAGADPMAFPHDWHRSLQRIS